MQNTLSRNRKRTDGAQQESLTEQLLITLLKRQDDQTKSINNLAVAVKSNTGKLSALTDKLNAVTGDVVSAPSNADDLSSIKSASKNQQITTAVALVVFALTVLALIFKGCGKLG